MLGELAEIYAGQSRAGVLTALARKLFGGRQIQYSEIFYRAAGSYAYEVLYTDTKLGHSEFMARMLAQTIVSRDHCLVGELQYLRTGLLRAEDCVLIYDFAEKCKVTRDKSKQLA